FRGPMRFSVDVSRVGRRLLVQGSLSARLSCDCSRCLKTFEYPLDIPDFSALADLEGEEAVPRDGDFADLTTLVREDTLLALPRKPLCKPECRGLAFLVATRDSRLRVRSEPSIAASPWAALDQLKL